jgi:hypothetical protein
VSDPSPAEILRRAKPIPIGRDLPDGPMADIAGVDPEGAALTIEVGETAAPVLLLFLSAACLGCRDLWEGTAALRAALPEGVRVVLVTRGPGAGTSAEDAAAIGALAPADAVTVMSTQAFRDYRVDGPPFFCVVAGGRLRAEGVAWGVADTAEDVRRALGALG